MSATNALPNSDFFTLVFRGDVRCLKRNPLFERTEFGECIVVSIGDMTEEVEALRKELLELQRAEK